MPRRSGHVIFSRPMTSSSARCSCSSSLSWTRDVWCTITSGIPQLREATPFSEGPRFLIRDNDNKLGEAFARVGDGTGIEALRTPYGAPKADAAKLRAVCERFLGSVRRECLDHMLIFSERHLHRVMKQYWKQNHCSFVPKAFANRTLNCLRRTL